MHPQVATATKSDNAAAAHLPAGRISIEANRPIGSQNAVIAAATPVIYACRLIPT
jgi:hypothetical protein